MSVVYCGKEIGEGKVKETEGGGLSNGKAGGKRSCSALFYCLSALAAIYLMEC